MARDESSREDLLREATALVERIEFAARATESLPVAGHGDEHIVAGFRRDGALSVFFGEDPVYQFNAAGELRRAYKSGKLLKAAGGRLVSLTRVRAEHETQLVRHDLTPDEQAAFETKMQEDLKGFARLLHGNGFNVIGQMPADADILGRVKNWFTSHKSWPIATKPDA
jgi:hypothetical protein